VRRSQFEINKNILREGLHIARFSIKLNIFTKQICANYDFMYS